MISVYSLAKIRIRKPCSFSSRASDDEVFD